MADYHSGNLKYSQLKEGVANAIVALTNGFKSEKAKLMENKTLLVEQIYDSSADIRTKAQKTVREVREITGLGLGKQAAIDNFLKGL